MSSDERLLRKIDVLEEPIHWNIKVLHATCEAGTSGPHHVFVTWDIPRGAPTLRRVAYACDVARGANSIAAAAERFRDHIADDPGFTGPGLINDPLPWSFLDRQQLGRTPGDCITLAGLAVVGLETVGIRAQLCKAYPTTDGSEGHPVSVTTCQTKQTRLIEYGDGWFRAVLIYGPPTDMNNFEGFFTVQDPQIKAYTVYPAAGPFENQTYYYLEVLRRVAGPEYPQRWVSDENVTANGVIVFRNGSPVPNEPNVAVPSIPSGN